MKKSGTSAERLAMAWKDTDDFKANDPKFLNASFDINRIGQIGNFAGQPVQQWQLDVLTGLADISPASNEAAANRLKEFVRDAKILIPERPSIPWTAIKPDSNPYREASAYAAGSWVSDHANWQLVGDWHDTSDGKPAKKSVSELEKDLKFIQKELVKERQARMKAQDDLEAERRFIRDRTVLTKEQAEAVADLLAASSSLVDDERCPRGHSRLPWREYVETVSKAESLLTIQVPTKVEAIVGMRKILEDTECE